MGASRNLFKRCHRIISYAETYHYRRAIKLILQGSNTSMTPRAIFDEIIRNNYYTFGAQDPFGVMRSELRTHSEGIDFPTASPRKYFKYLPDGTFTLLAPDNIVKTKKSIVLKFLLAPLCLKL